MSKIRKIKKQPSMEGFFILQIVSSLVNPASPREQQKCPHSLLKLHELFFYREKTQ